MKAMRQVISLLMVVALVGLGQAAQAQRRAYRMTDRQVEQIIRRVETRADRFRASLDASLDRSRIDGTRTEDSINNYVRDFESATDNLRSRFDSRRSVAADVQAILTQASSIDQFMMSNRLATRAQNDWSLLKADLNALASAYGVRWNWSAQRYPQQQPYPQSGSTTQPYRMSDREVGQIIRRVEASADRFRASLDASLDNSPIDGTRREDRINEFVREFEAATDQLRSRFNSRSSVAGDVENVLNRASNIDNFMRRNRLTTRVQNDWTTLRTDLNTLASAYSVAWNWQIPGGVNTLPGGAIGSGGYNTPDTRLTGTFRLDPSRSDNTRDIVDRATRTLPYADRQRTYDAMLSRLEAPDMLAIERRGSNVTIASSRAPQTTFEADGRVRTEQLPNGVVARVTAALNGDQLVVSSQGYRENDFNVTFEPLNNGRGLRVTRRIYSDRLTQPVVVQNTYDRIADVAQWNNVYNGTNTTSNPNYPTQTASGDFIIRDGEMLVATLNNDVTTKTTQEGDRFSMTVRSPSQYEGAVIEGTVSDISRSGRISGRSGVTFNFNTIRLRDGRSYRFAGFVDNVRTSSGETVKVDNEGQIRDDNQTEKTVQRAAIGTAVGAIIGAIAGGGKGAAIGAIIGAGTGAGSVYVQGRDELELFSGSEVTVRASAPGTVR